MGSKSNRMKIDPKVFLGLVSHQRNNPAICTDLKKLGIGDAVDLHVHLKRCKALAGPRGFKIHIA